MHKHLVIFYASPTQNLASPVKRIHPNYCHMDYSTPTHFRSKPMRYRQKIIYHLTKHYGKSAYSLAFVFLTKRFFFYFADRKSKILSIGNKNDKH